MPRPPPAPWMIIGASVITLMLTGPGQTVGVSVFVDSLIEDLDLSRSAVSAAYLIGTLSGALAMPFAGRLIDRHGIRRATIGFAAGFSVVLVAMSGVVGFVTLAIGFAGTRMLGQGALTLTASTSVALWFDRNRGTAMGTVSALGGGAMSLVPIAAALMIGAWGWRWTWVALGMIVAAVLLPLGWFVVVDPDRGPRPVATGRGGADAPPTASWPVSAVLRTPMFWVVTSGVGLAAMIGTGLVFHQITLLEARGLTAAQAAANFLPQTAAAALGAIVAGRLADRVSSRILIPTAMALLAAAPLLVQVVGPGAGVVAYAVILGGGGGAMRTIEGTVLPRWFGIRTIGELRGIVMGVAVASSAVGPILFSVANDLMGGYGPMLSTLAVLPVLTGVGALTAPIPDPRVFTVMSPE